MTKVIVQQLKETTTTFRTITQLQECSWHPNVPKDKEIMPYIERRRSSSLPQDLQLTRDVFPSNDEQRSLLLLKFVPLHVTGSNLTNVPGKNSSKSLTWVHYQLRAPISVHHCQLGKTDVVADADAQPAGSCVQHGDSLPARQRLRLFECDLAGDVDVEQMHLPAANMLREANISRVPLETSRPAN